MKENLKVFGVEIIYLLTTIVVACISSLIQLIGRAYEGEYSSFIFSGSEYTYSYFFYFLGMGVYIGFMIVWYKYFLKKRIIGLSGPGIADKIVFLIIALVFSVLMLFALFISALYVLEFDNMNPDYFLGFTLFGWPVFCFVFMVCIEIVAIKRSVKEVKS